MDMPPTRKERQAATRERLLEVATKMLFESGYGATSLDRIAEAAGFSKGAVYSNFSGKEELVLEVLDRQFLHRLDDLVERLDRAPKTPEDRFGAFIDWWDGLLTGEGWGLLVFEFAGATRDNPDIHEQLAGRQQRVVQLSAELLEREIARFDLRPELAPREIAGMLIALGQGLTYSRQLTPEISSRILVKTARAILFGPAAPPSPSA